MSDSAPPPPARAASRGLEAGHVKAVRLGQGANCSSIGSVIDTLFATGALGVAAFAMILAAMRSESITVVGPTPTGATGNDAKGPRSPEAE